MVKTVNADEIVEGVKLAEPVINNFRQILIPAGTQLGASHIRIIRTWNVKSIAVQGEGETVEFVLTENLRLAAEEKLKQRVHWTPRNQPEQDLWLMGVTKVAHKMARQVGGKP